MVEIIDTFNIFIGRQINVIENHENYLYSKLDENDPVIQELNKQARTNSLTTRFWFPMSLGTCDIRTDRVNIIISRHEIDHIWYINKIYLQ